MSLTKILGTKYPIIQGAMAQIATADLASAVSNAGGLGVIASGGFAPERIREEIKFNSLDELVAQIRKDEDFIKNRQIII